jgi:anti-anti-sigma factor
LVSVGEAREVAVLLMTSDVTLEARDGVVVVTLTGEFDLSRPDALSEYVRVAMVDNPPRVVVDLSNATFLDSTVLGVLVGAGKAARERAGWLRLTSAHSTAVQRIIEVTELDVALGLFDSVADAIKADD